jgi:DNA-directed RNA polymerase specialized sigma24 family protein
MRFAESDRCLRRRSSIPRWRRTRSRHWRRRSELLERYDRALDRLETEAREAVIARIEMGCSYAEIALALGKPSPDAARMTVSRALLKLAEEMGNAR